MNKKIIDHLNKNLSVQRTTLKGTFGNDYYRYEVKIKNLVLGGHNSLKVIPLQEIKDSFIEILKRSGRYEGTKNKISVIEAHILLEHMKAFKQINNKIVNINNCQEIDLDELDKEVTNDK